MRTAQHVWRWLRLLWRVDAVRAAYVSPPLTLAIATLLDDPALPAIRAAVEKQNLDPQLKTAHPDVKWKEAIEWAERYGREVHGVAVSGDAWKTRALLELVVGQATGKLPLLLVLALGLSVPAFAQTTDATKVTFGGTAQPVSQSGSWTVSFGSAQLVNVSQLNGTTVDTNSGTKSAGTLRIVFATDQPSNTNAFLVAGAKTNNNAAPGATNVGVLPALANTSAPTYSDGNLVLLSTDTSGGLRVNCTTGCSGSSFADNAAFTFGTTAIGLSGGVLDDVSPNAATENSAALARISSNRNLYFQLRDGAAGAERGASITAANALKVDGSAVTQPVSGTVAATQSGAWSLAANQSVNVAQINGVTPLMGNGATGTGSPRVTIASDNTAFTVNAAQSGSWNVTNISGTISLPTGASTAAKQPALGTAGAASTDVLTVQGIASMTALKVDGSGVTQPVSGTVAATQSGTWTVQPGNTANTTPWLTSIVGTGNTASVNGSNQLAVNCANCSGSGVSQQDNTGFVVGSGNFVPVGGLAAEANPAILAEGSAGAARLTGLRELRVYDDNVEAGLAAVLRQLAGLSLWGPTPTALKGALGNRVGVTGDSLNAFVTRPLPTYDPCMGLQKRNLSISQAASTQILTAIGGVMSICSLVVVGADAENLSLVEGSGATCGTGTAAVIGGTTAAAGPNLSAGGGFTLGNGGATIAVTATPQNNLCLLQSGSGRVAGNLTYVIR